MEKLPGVENKINEYVARIQNGEEKESVLEGLGPVFRSSVEERLPEEQKKISDLREEIKKDLGMEKEILSQESILERKKLHGWSASYELARVAKKQGVDLSKLSREEYADFAISNYLAIDDSQLRAQPWQRMSETVDEVLVGMRERKALILEENEKAFAKFSFEMMQLAQKEQKERYLSEDVRILSGTKDSNSWLFFAINKGTDSDNAEVSKSYFSLKDLNQFSPAQFKSYMETLQKRGYNGGVKIFQDLTEQGTKLNDQIVMHGYSEDDAKLAIDVAKEVFGDNIEDTSFGVDENTPTSKRSYSQILAEKIKDAIANKT